MAGQQTVWGIDVGRSALKAVKLRAASDTKVELIAFDYIEHAKILSQPDADRNTLIADALEKFLSGNDITRDDIVVSVPGQHTLSRFTKLPPVQPKKIPDIVRYEADQQIPFDMDEVIWDYQTFQREGYPDVEVGIFAMKRELIREHLLHFEQAAIEPIIVQSSPLAIYNAARFDGLLAEHETILLDIGAENTDLVIATPHGLWTRTIPIGGNKFTEALVKFFKLSFSRAEALKRTAPSSKYARQIFQAMRPVFADLVQELQRSIGFYSSTHREAEFEKAVGLGNAFRLPGLPKYLQQNLGMPVEIPSAFKRLDTSSASEVEQFTQEILSFGVAYGLALQGLDLTKVSSNLLPTEIAKQAIWRKKRPTFAAAAACLVLAGGSVWFRQSADMSALRAGGQGADLISVSLAEADRVIAGSIPAALSPRARAMTVLKAGQVMQREVSRLRSEGLDEQSQVETLLALQQNKTVIPSIYRVIYDSLPTPQDDLAQAATPAQLVEAIAGAGIARDQREQITIETLEMRYDNDINFSIDWETNPLIITDYLIDPEAEDVARMLVVMVCSSPHKDGTMFFVDRFLDRLRQGGRQPGLGFYIDRVFLIETRQVDLDARRGTERKSMGGYRGGLRGAGGGSSRGATVSDAQFKLDPITDESLDNDWEFELQLDIVIGEDWPEEDPNEGLDGG